MKTPKNYLRQFSILAALLYLSTTILFTLPVGADKLSIGKAHIQLPTPAGFLEITSTFPEMVRRIQKVQATVRILGLFAPEEEVALFTKEGRDYFKVLAVAQMPVALENELWFFSRSPTEKPRWTKRGVGCWLQAQVRVRGLGPSGGGGPWA